MMKHKRRRRTPLKQLQKELVEYNKFLQQMRQPKLSIEEYRLLKRGQNIARPHPRVANKQASELPLSRRQQYVQERAQESFEKYPDGSLQRAAQTQGDCSRREKETYTGTKIIGIVVMHKSNLVPVTSKDQAEDTAKMRRG